jgi:hypothetical protein
MKEQLQEISNESHADSIDLWPEIYAEIKEGKKVKNSSRGGFVLSRVTVVLVLFFVGAVVYAFGQFFEPIYVDSGLEGERAERLITPINESVMLGDTTVRLDWVYIDVNRMSVGYSILDETGRIYRTENPRLYYSAEVHLRRLADPLDTSYRPYVPIIGDSRLVYDSSLDQQIMSTVIWDHWEYQNQDVLDLIDQDVEVDFRIIWKGQLYRFLVETHIYPAQFEIRDAVMIPNDYGMMLQEVSVTATMTSLTFCYQLPEEFKERGTLWNHWEVGGFRLYFDDRNLAEFYPEASPEVWQTIGEDSANCNVIFWAIPSDVLPQTIRFELDEVHPYINGEYTLEQAEFLVEQYEARGISLESTLGYQETERYGVWPEELYNLPFAEQQAIYKDVMGLFYEAFPEMPRILGPWEIELDVSEAVN